jgi:hypothetical protein
MRSKCPTGTGYRVSHLSHPLFFAETQRLQVSHLLSHVGQQRDAVSRWDSAASEDKRDGWDSRDKWDTWDGRDVWDAGTAPATPFSRGRRA